ncbi:MAG: hypothetical protein U0R78_00900 [Nocardioidaceae bacterium]
MTFRPVISSQADLEAAWRFLMKPLGFSGESLWFMLVEPDGTVVPSITQLEDAAEPPDDDVLLSLTTHLSTMIDDLDLRGARVAFRRSRPGGGGPDARDRAWARSITSACRLVGLPCEVVHLATDHDVHPLPGDDLVAAAT